MKYTKAKLVSALALNSPIEKKLEEELQAKINEVNALLRAKEDPSVAQVEADTKADELAPYSMWCDTLRYLISECEELKTETLTDEQARIALTRVREYTCWTSKQNNETKFFEKKGTQTPIDLIGMFTKLGVDLSEFKKYFPSLTLSVALYANARLSKGEADNSKIIANYKGDEEVRKNLMNGADLSSRNSICKAIDNCVNAFMPSAGFKAFKSDAEVFYLASTSISKKDLTDVRAGAAKKVLATFLNFAHKLLVNNGTVIYNVKYKSSNIKAKEYDMLVVEPEKAKVEETEPKPEETAEKSAAPAEKPKRERKPKPEKAAAKQSKEPAAKTGKGKSGKSKTEAAA